MVQCDCSFKNLKKWGGNLVKMEKKISKDVLMGLGLG
jgi:hypothetical protein